MIERLENTPEILMQAPIGRAFSQSTFAALLFRSSATTVAVPGMPAIGTAVGVTNMQGFRTARREGKTGVRARVTRLVWRALPYPGSDVTSVGS